MTLEREGHEARGPGFGEERDHRSTERVHWERRAGGWAAEALARHVFGDPVEARLLPGGGRPPFRGMLVLRVPFRGLEDHRLRESVFLSLAQRDPVVSQVPFLYFFEPLEVPAAGPAGAPS